MQSDVSKIIFPAHPGNRTPVSTVGGYYDTTTPDALYIYKPKTINLNLCIIFYLRTLLKDAIFFRKDNQQVFFTKHAHQNQNPTQIFQSPSMEGIKLKIATII